MNERIFEISRGRDRFEVLCECGAAGCFSQVEVACADYVRLQAEDATFLAPHGDNAGDRDSAAFEPIMAPACAV